MYLSFYGLNEKPFNLTPDASFLYPSQIHREVLGHLLYGIGNRKGFICVTGEVGSGKTTLCRVLLNQLDENTEVAFVLNSYLTEFELLKTINEDLGIATTGRTRKELIDELNRYLLEQNGKGKNVVVIIDEAQNLSIPVLEQLRMLSNLETEKEKLLQIVLVGQPELSKLLENEKIRQLNQRITVRHHLTPLSKEELREYIYYRLNVAGSRGDVVFTDGAVNDIFRFSRGIPRAINVICDQALLVGYVSNSRRITRNMVRKAIHEVWGNRSDEVAGRQFRMKKVASRAAAGFVLAAVLMVGYFATVNYLKHSQLISPLSANDSNAKTETAALEPADLVFSPVEKENPPTSEKEAETPVSETPEMEKETLAAAETNTDAQPVPDDEVEEESSSLIMTAMGSGTGSLLGKEINTAGEPLENYKTGTEDSAPQETVSAASTADAVAGDVIGEKEIDATIDILRLWKVEQRYIQAVQSISDGFAISPDKAAKASGMGFVFIRGDFDTLKTVNLPAVLKVKTPGNDPAYVALEKLSDTTATVLVSSKEASIEIEQLRAMMTGEMVFYCSDTFVNPTVLQADMEMSIDVRKLQDYLKTLGCFKGNCNGWFTEETKTAVMKFQSENNINPSGEVTGYTKILIYGKIPQKQEIPRLAQ